MALKKAIKKILKIIWFSLGGFILLMTILIYIKMHSINTLGVIEVAILFAALLYILFIFIIITFLYYIIKWMIRKWTKKT